MLRPCRAFIGSREAAKSLEPQFPGGIGAEGITMPASHTALSCCDFAVTAGSRGGGGGEGCSEVRAGAMGIVVMSGYGTLMPGAGCLRSLSSKPSGDLERLGGSQLPGASGKQQRQETRTRQYRTEVSLEIPSDKLFPFVYLPEYRSKWDKSLQSYKLVETIDQDTFIYRSITHSYGFGMVSPRDFVYLLHVKTYDGNLMTTNSISVAYPDLPATPAYIRGTTFSSGYACLPLPENPEHTRLQIIIQVDLGGFLIPSVIDHVMPMSLINFVTDCKAGFKMLRETET
ncbi:stAR-related lipid transfer protein 6 [Crotalus adamanteus]|uniref:StAR-related lipid transfer protein 6 n=1 Tax=Crotalus adamanteus TaxID=8729 RepID=A0AAW1C4E5_CROAD